MKNTNTQKKSILGGVICINDLREMEFNNVELSPQERLALKNYDRYRIVELNKQSTEDQYNNKYMQLQAIANLSPFTEFLKEEYYI